MQHAIRRLHDGTQRLRLVEIAHPRTYAQARQLRGAFRGAGQRQHIECGSQLRQGTPGNVAGTDYEQSQFVWHHLAVILSRHP